MPEQKPLAVDVVLLPDPAAGQEVVRLNRRLLAQGPGAIRLGLEAGMRPHLSLLMGVLAPEHREETERRLQGIAGSFPALDLVLDRVEVKVHEGGSTSVLAVRPHSRLQALHEAVVRDLDALLGREVHPGMLADAESDPPGEGTLQWIRTYREEAALQHFAPHVTAGKGTLPPLEHPIPMHAGMLALCHLGNACTCRDLLARWRLGAQEGTGAGPHGGDLLPDGSMTRGGGHSGLNPRGGR